MNHRLPSHLRKASEFLDNEDEESALRELEEAFKLDPQSPQAHLLRADARRLLRQFQTALADYECADSLGADRGRVHLGWGICLSKRLEHEQALPHFEIAVEQKPNCADAYYWRGRCFYELKKHELSLNDLNKAIEIAGVFPEAMAFRKLPQDALHQATSPDQPRPCPHAPAAESKYYAESHPEAKALLVDSFYWCGCDFCPIGGDIGWDVMDELWPWRMYNPNRSMTRFLQDLLQAWGYTGSQINAVANSQTKLATGDLHVTANVYDDIVIAVAFGQFMMDGYLDSKIRTRALLAIERQSDPEVLDYRDGTAEAVEAKSKTKSALLRMRAKTV